MPPLAFPSPAFPSPPSTPAQRCIYETLDNWQGHLAYAGQPAKLRTRCFSQPEMKRPVLFLEISKSDALTLECIKLGFVCCQLHNRRPSSSHQLLSHCNRQPTYYSQPTQRKHKENAEEIALGHYIRGKARDQRQLRR